LLAWFTATQTSAATGQQEPATDQEEPESAERPEPGECISCHEGRLTLFNRTHHAAEEESCYACHIGPEVEEHSRLQDEGIDAPVTRPDALPIEEANAICLGCHERDDHATWEGSAHQRRGMRCSDCHSVHSFESDVAQLWEVDSATACYECHQPIRAQMLRTSHHPVREGLLGCESCHNPHDGSRPKMIHTDWTNDLCYQCHTEKRGPFLWEHVPVRENCLNCHNPHGSNHDKMLVAKQPFLCQRCHLNVRHPGTFFDGLNSGSTIAGASNFSVAHSCKNCHQNIHGGNAPSGPYLGR
jgi:DmsE family decaheme c-type cytochrome